MREDPATITTESWAVDAFVIDKLVEDVAAYSKLDDFLPDLTQDQLDENEDWYSQHGFDSVSKKVLLSYHSYVIRSKDSVVLIDSCIGAGKSIALRPNWHRRTDDRWLQQLASLGVEPDDVDIVVHTHLHVDHVGWNTRLVEGAWVATFPNARHIVCASELTEARARAQQEHGPIGELLQATLRESIDPLLDAKRVDLVPTTHDVFDWLRIRPLPGHTPSHAMVIVGTGVDAAIFTGDALYTALQFRLPHLSTWSDEDRRRAARSRESLLATYAGTDTMIFTGHLPSPSVGRVAISTSGYEFVPVDPTS